MKLWTYQEILQKVTTDLDLQEQTFITPDELVGYCNEAIHEAASEILTLNEDYFLSSAPLTLVVGQRTYPLPTDMYAQKVRSIQYVNGAINYPIRRIRGGVKFDDLTMVDQYGVNDDYRYIMYNPTAGQGPEIQLHPNSRDAGTFVTIWYIRQAKYVPTAAEQGIKPTDPNNATQLATILDIPEFTSFIIDYMKTQCLAKDGDPRFTEQNQKMMVRRKMMVDSLTQQVPDDQDNILPDMSLYHWHS